METKVKNIIAIYNLATEQERIDGLNWYSDAKKICVRLAKKYGIPVKTVCYVMAALSPNNKWQRNIMDTVRVLELFKSGELASKANSYEQGNKLALAGIACTYSANTFKAFNILATGDYSHLKGLKVNNFAQNIHTPKNDNVTIDYHAISIADGFRNTVNSVDSKKYKGKRYQEYVDAYKKAAEILGVAPNQAQSVTWCAWRNVDKFKPASEAK